MNNKLLKKGSALEKAQMRFRETSNSLMCNVVWSMGLKLLKKFMGVNAGNVMAKFKESELANKHNLGDICEKSESTHDSEYLRNLWKSIYAELIRNFPEDANLPIPAGLPIPKDRVIAIMKNVLIFWEIRLCIWILIFQVEIKKGELFITSIRSTTNK